MRDRDPVLALAERLFGAIVAGDVEAVREIYAPEARIWHNTDGVEQTADENLRVLRWLTANVSSLRYEEIRLQRTDRGFIQQHVLRGTTAAGRPIELPACLIGTVADGRITRIDEYFDSAHLAPLGALG
jgi:ketosteroid isomerase-like protein